jgi:hypothetical protein
MGENESIQMGGPRENNDGFISWGAREYDTQIGHNAGIDPDVIESICVVDLGHMYWS